MQTEALWGAVRDSKLSTLERAVLLALCAHGTGPVSRATLGRLVGCSPRATSYAIRALTEGGWVHVSRGKAGDGGTIANSYEVSIPAKP